MRPSLTSLETVGDTTHRLPRWLRWIALLLLCAAYLQGGLVKLTNFPARWLRCSTSACRLPHPWRRQRSCLSYVRQR